VVESACSTSCTNDDCRRLLLNPLPYNVLLVVPVAGTFAFEKASFGGIRRNGILGDWVCGGFVPLALVSASAIASRKSDRAGRALLYSALGFYIGTRFLVYPPANHHIRTFNEFIRRHCPTDSFPAPSW
jgi:hypothetical protein